MSGPRVESLLCFRWLNVFGGYLPFDEETVTQAQRVYEEKLPVGPMEEHLYRNQRFATLLRTAGVFVLDPREVPPGLAETHGDLPPLPFARMWFEFHVPESDHFMPCLRFVDADNRLSWLYGVGIYETKPCEEWSVTYLMMEADAEGVPEPTLMAVRDFGLRAAEEAPHFGTDPEEMAYSGLSEDDRTRWLAIAYALPTTLVNLVNVLGVRHEPVLVPRGERRRWERRYGFDHPRIYRVDLRDAGDEPGEHETTGGDGRRMHVRFLVRGHYRREPNGEYDVPGKGRCGWVRPHVKGPKGAPFKGRPVHVA